MGRCLIRVECPEERFLEWSSIVDAPITYGMTEEELRNYIKEEYGNQGLERLDQRLKLCRETGTSARGWSLESILSYNRAGPDETHLSLEGIIEEYCHNRPEEK